MRRLGFLGGIIFLLLAYQAFSLGNIYGSGTLGIFPRFGETKFLSLEKYEGALGFEFELLRFITLATEFRYAQGLRDFQIPWTLSDKVTPEKFGGFKDRGVYFTKVRYFELWLRPKLLLPLPFVSLYLVFPLNLLGYGGMKGYGKFSSGLGILGGISIAISSFQLFMESGILIRFQKGDKNLLDKPPWGSFDPSLPITLGFGYKI